MPLFGPALQETEVWIKGCNINDKGRPFALPAELKFPLRAVSVTFDNIPVRVSETSDNLVVVHAPPRYDIFENTPVQVVICNTFSAEKNLCSISSHTFTYCVVT